ncbi:hypothetical protein G8759_19900 [Spirosoma aureum]|uniref:Uncharacterized protein n=1 Tax=Spirosoma aureum TaxID=2692134 RepID=A0A6G9AR12_9BACT|nr:hypothetical protein [Spirosoma aureum]QIP14715.1 hypothetical protein G8759_19900 [Spirosoma aureum]
MLTLKLYPIDVLVMIGYLRANLNGQDQVPLVHKSVNTLVLLNYLKSWKTLKMISWSQRRADKLYSFSMPEVVAKALYLDMLSMVLTSHQQLFLGKLDHAIVNYQIPITQMYNIGE